MANIVSDIKIHLKPTIYLTIDGTASRTNGEQSNKVTYSFSYSMTLGSGSYYGSSNAIGLRFNVDSTSHVGYIVGNNYSGNSGSISFTTTNTNTSGSSSITIDVWCHQGTFASPTGENCNCTASSGSSATYFGQKSSPYYGTITGVSLSYTPYNPYTAPSISMNSSNYTKIGRVGSTSYNVNYSLTSGTARSEMD